MLPSFSVWPSLAWGGKFVRPKCRDARLSSTIICMPESICHLPVLSLTWNNFVGVQAFICPPSVCPMVSSVFAPTIPFYNLWNDFIFSHSFYWLFMIFPFFLFYCLFFFRIIFEKSFVGLWFIFLDFNIMLLTFDFALF